MKKHKMIEMVIFIVGVIVCVFSYFYLSGTIRAISCIGSGILAVFFLILASTAEERMEREGELQEDIILPGENITEVVLLNEDDEIIAAWEMYGKSSLVIGRDVGENQVTVNLSEAAFASMIDIEHAVLNYSGGQWYVEDLGSKNGISIIKSDGKKYQLAPYKPCLVELGDVLYIAMTRLMFR